MFKEFAESAGSLARNPLGILALFLVLVYGFACLVVVKGQSLQTEERIILVWFLVLFPGIILGTFFRLVTKHHAKLYSPSDYKDENLFLHSIPPNRVEERRIEEAKAVIAVAEQTPGEDESNSSIQDNTAIRDPKYITEKIKKVESFALEKMESKLGLTIDPNVVVGGSEFDGASIKDRTLHMFEIKYFSRPHFKPEIFEAIIHRATEALFGSVFSRVDINDSVLHLVIVYDFASDKFPDFERRIRGRVTSKVIDVKIEFLRYNE